MSGTVTGLDLDRLEALVAAHDDNPPEALGGECDCCHVEDVRSALAAAAAVQRVEALLDQYDRYEEPMPSDRRHGRVPRAEVRAALGTEQEGRTE